MGVQVDLSVSCHKAVSARQGQAYTKGVVLRLLWKKIISTLTHIVDSTAVIALDCHTIPASQLSSQNRLSCGPSIYPLCCCTQALSMWRKILSHCQNASFSPVLKNSKQQQPTCTLAFETSGVPGLRNSVVLSSWASAVKLGHNSHMVIEIDLQDERINSLYYR